MILAKLKMQALHKQNLHAVNALILCLTHRYNTHNIFPHIDVSSANDMQAEELQTNPYTALSYALRNWGHTDDGQAQYMSTEKNTCNSKSLARVAHI